VRELATCAFVARKENVFFAGPSGVGNYVKRSIM